MRWFIPVLTLAVGLVAGYAIARGMLDRRAPPGPDAIELSIRSETPAGEVLFETSLVDREGARILGLQGRSTPFDTTVTAGDLRGTITPMSEHTRLHVEVRVLSGPDVVASATTSKVGVISLALSGGHVSLH
jgi:hypothetical protein